MNKRRKRNKIRNKEKKFLMMPKDNIITLVIIILDNVNKKIAWFTIISKPLAV